MVVPVRLHLFKRAGADILRNALQLLACRERDDLGLRSSLQVIEVIERMGDRWASRDLAVIGEDRDALVGER